jgi:Uma2 family endonuclease
MLPPKTARLTVDQYHRMLKAGVLKEGAPLELRRGVLTFKNRSARGADPMTVGENHIYVVNLLNELSAALHTHGCFIQTQNPVVVQPNHEPEPDGAVLRGTIRDYKGRKAAPRDVLALIEVSDTSLEDDQTDKLSEYADSGIEHYIIINIPDRQIEVFEHPQQGSGKYAQARIYKPGDTLPIPVADGKSFNIPVKDLLP